MLDRTPITRLVQIALRQETLTGITDLLRGIAEELNSWGALIWVLADSAQLEKDEGRLFVLAHWVKDANAKVWHEIGLNSMAGWVLKHKQPGQARPDDERAFKPTPKLVVDSGTQWLALAPLHMLDSKLEWGEGENPTVAVLEIYRQQAEPFSEAEMLLLTEVASVLPVLYANLTDRVGTRLLNRVNDISRLVSADKLSYDDVWQQIVSEIAQTFASLEASIFVRSKEDEPGVFPLAAHEKVWEGEWTGTKEYRVGQGATGYVLATGEPVQLNLSHYYEDLEFVDRKYPGLRWEDSLGIEGRVRDYFEAAEGEPVPPIDFLCAPIKAGNDILGAIRCSGAKASPFYFDAWQARYLEALGVRLGSWWENIQKQKLLNHEVVTLRDLMAGFDRMNRFVQRQLYKRNWDETAFFKEAMQLAHSVIPKIDNSDVVLIDGNDLATVAVYGPDWDKYPKAKTARYRIQPPESSASHLLGEEKQVAVYNNVDDAPSQRLLFEGTKKLVLAKIEAGENVYGVLRIRSKSAQPFSANVGTIAQLLAQQLGLYHSLAQKIEGLQTAEQTNRKLIETQGRTLGDVHHQVKTPIINAHRTAQRLIANPKLPGSLRPELERVRGLCAKVSRVVRNMGVFANLAEGKPIVLEKTLLPRGTLLRMLRDARDDHQALMDEDRELRFELVEKSFEELAGPDRVGKLLEADQSLLEQCINNLVDNAAKYSYDQTTVVLSGGVQARGTQFYISVVNEGFEIEPRDASQLKLRGFRSDQAISVTGEGSGIGLWIVDEIMKAHGGRLEITPTHNQRNEFRLAFPVLPGIESLTYETKSPNSRR